MLQNHANIDQIRVYLFGELRKKYPENESSSMVRLVLEHIGYPFPNYLNDPETVPGSHTISQINEIVTEIHTGRPIQYVLGHTHFCDLMIGVDERVFIPRPETEEMVYLIKSDHSVFGERMIDLGTGSGCIALALKKMFPEGVVTGLDSSMAALEKARENGISTGSEVNWIQWDLLNPELPALGPFDLVVSNPPYVLNSERKLMAENVLDFEPGSALFVKDSDPLIYYRAIAAFCKTLLIRGGVLYVEINEKFGEQTAGIYNREGFTEVSLLKDIHGKERFIRGRK